MAKIDTVIFLAADRADKNASAEIQQQLKVIKKQLCSKHQSKEVTTLYRRDWSAPERAAKLLEVLNELEPEQYVQVVVAYPAVISSSFMDVVELGEMLDEQGHALVFASDAIERPTDL
jgi:hypothetical protein